MLTVEAHPDGSVRFTTDSFYVAHPNDCEVALAKEQVALIINTASWAVMSGQIVTTELNSSGI